jgi:hypothetical protein
MWIAPLRVADDELADCQKWYHAACLPSVSHPVPSEMVQLRASGLGMMDDLPWRDLELGPQPAGGGARAGVLGDLITPSTDDVYAEGTRDGSKGLIKAVNGVLGSGDLTVDAAAEGAAESTERILGQVARAAEESILRGTAESGIVGSAKRVLSARELLAFRSTGAVGDKVWGEMAKAWEADYHVGDESSEDHLEGAKEGVREGKRGGLGGRKKSIGRVAAAAGSAGAAQSHAYWQCPTCQNVI